METTTVQPLITPMTTLLELLKKQRYSSSGLHRTGIEYAEGVLKGEIKIVEANNPLVYLMEVSAANTATFSSTLRDNLRLSHPNLAITEEDLYRYMSDKDYEDIYALPGSCRVEVAVLDPSVEKVATTDPATGIRRMTIPKGTIVDVNGVELMFDSAVAVEKYSSNNYVIRTKSDGVEHVIPCRYNRIKDQTWVIFDISLKQQYVRAIYTGLTKSTYFRKRIELEHDYHKIEVLTKSPGEAWRPLVINYSKDMFDPGVITALVSVGKDKVEITINDEYMSDPLMGEELKILIYTTDVSEPLYYVDTVPQDKISVTYRKLDTDTELTPEENAMTLSTTVMRPITPVEGHRKKLDFNQLKHAMINNNIGRNKYPISRTDVSFRAAMLGYSVRLAIDIYTERLYAAYKPSLSPKNHGLYFNSPLKSAVRRIPCRYTELIKLPSVHSDLDKDWCTIPSGMLATEKNGLIKLISSNTVTGTIAAAKTIAEKIKIIEEEKYMFLPFSYHLDYSSEIVTITPYRTDKPLVKSNYILNRNTSVADSIATGKTEILHEPGRYIVRVSTSSTEAMRKTATPILASLSLIVEGVRRYFDGALIRKEESGESVFEFSLHTNLKFVEGKLEVHNGDNVVLPIDSETEFDLSYSMSAPPIGFIEDPLINTVVKPVGVNPPVGGMTSEKLRVESFVKMDHLWSMVTTVADEAPYKKHTSDKPMVYGKDILDRDATGRIKGIGADCKGKPVILHKKGDPVLDAGGNPKFLYKKGDTVLGANGRPERDGLSSGVSFLDIVLVEAAPLFSNNEKLKAYLKSFVDKLHRDATVNIAPLAEQMLEKTDVRFKPITNIGTVTATIGDNQSASISNQIDIGIDLTVSKDIYSDQVALNNIKKEVSLIVSEYFTNDVLVRSELNDKLREKLGGTVLDSTVKRFLDANVVSITKDSSQFAVAKRVVPVGRDAFTYEDKIEINFISYSIS